MSFNSGIGTLISTDSVIAPLLTNVYTQVSPVEIDNSVATPHIYYTKISNPAIEDDGYSWVRLRIWIRDITSQKAEIIRDRIRLIFDFGAGTVGTTGFEILNSRMIDNGSDPVWNSDISKYECFADARITYKY